MKKVQNMSIGCSLLSLAIMILLLVGEVKCIIKFVTSDFDPIGKREIVYGIGTFTGLGCVIGWMDIKDKPDAGNN